ncbi:unnamed protein product [Urochloa decumbens]|uniref:Uncharacterized protein n=1 Tax=Urochloa decumbens TaxID=240449 RepID=A0ABC8W7V9_9POAL
MMKRCSNVSSQLAALGLLLLICFFHSATAARLLPDVPPLVHQENNGVKAVAVDDGLVLQDGAAVNGDDLSVAEVRTQDTTYISESSDFSSEFDLPCLGSSDDGSRGGAGVRGGERRRVLAEAAAPGRPPRLHLHAAQGRQAVRTGPLHIFIPVAIRLSSTCRNVDEAASLILSQLNITSVRPN